MLRSIYREAISISDLSGFSISYSRDNLTNSFNISFIGLDQYAYLNPFATSPYLYQIKTGVTVDESDYEVTQISGYVDSRGERHNSGEILLNAEFYDKMKLLMHPYAEKILIDIYNYNALKRDAWEPGDDLEDKFGITSVSALITEILTLAGVSMNVNYMIYDYRIAFYRKEDYPANIIQDLVSFVGGYMFYNATTNTLEIRERFPLNNAGYDFLYKDNGDVTEISTGSKSMSFFNTVIVMGTLPDEFPEYETDDGLLPGLVEDNDLHLVDTISGKEPAPSTPFVDEPPEELIEKKFCNIWLGFEIDPATVELKGGSWNEENQQYEGAVFLGYGGQMSSDQVILSDVNDPALQQSGKILPPGEGLVGFPWLYEQNDQDASTKDYQLQNGVFRMVTVLGQVTDKLTGAPLPGATVEINFANENNIWQYWKHKDYNTVFLFYMPAGGVVLGPDFEDVTADYPALDPPTGFPKSTLTGNGEDTGEPDGKGVFVFYEMPLSDYTATGNAIGYNEGELEITFDSSSLDFQTGSGDDPSKKYRILDTPYNVEIYAKKLAPIQFGTEEEYSEDATFEPSKNIKVQVRHTRGIELVDGRIIFGNKIVDSRVISREIAIKAGTSAIVESLAKRASSQIELPHNPYLREGMNIAIESYSRGWTGSNVKVITVDSLETNYGVGQNGEEGLWDTVSGVEYL